MCSCLCAALLHAPLPGSKGQTGASRAGASARLDGWQEPPEVPGSWVDAGRPAGRGCRLPPASTSPLPVSVPGTPLTCLINLERFPSGNVGRPLLPLCSRTPEASQDFLLSAQMLQRSGLCREGKYN